MVAASRRLWVVRGHNESRRSGANPIEAATMNKPLSWWSAWWGRPGWERFVHIVAAVTFFLAAGVFLKLADAAPEGDYLPAENRIMQSMRTGGEPWGPAGTAAVVRDITALG